MDTLILKRIAAELAILQSGVDNTAELIQGGATIPFIARYRKERTGNLDEIQIRNISEKIEYYTELEKRKITILDSITEQNKLTPELEKEIKTCFDKTLLEDIYLPYKPKRKTRASMAREKGLDPLAQALLLDSSGKSNIDVLAAQYINPEKGVNTIEEAIAGASDIIAEMAAENAEIRQAARSFIRSGRVKSGVKKEFKEEKTKFEDYYEFSELVEKIPSHRFLAIRRGVNEGILSWGVEAEAERLSDKVFNMFLNGKRPTFARQIESAIQDSVKRLIYPSCENEVMKTKAEEAEEEAILVFASNLKALLLGAPAGSRVIMGVDPGFRTGCKVAVIAANGDFTEYTTVFPNPPQNDVGKAAIAVATLIKKHKVELIAVGNGTASKETFRFIKEVIKQGKFACKAVVVSEAGASVYSASELAAKEFPDLDVTVRGAISIARRLQDPLAELVKIDPRSIGVGQYQHDVDQKKLKKSLDFIVESCVNSVGIDLNTASKELLSYVAGIGPAIAKNIVEYRTKSGIKKRAELLKVAKLGPAAFEQCAGFLRVKNSPEPLDNSAIHPESYHIVKKMAADLQVDTKQLIGNEPLIAKIDIKKYVTPEAGLPTLKDIIAELKKPGLDPRKEFECVEFSDDINEISDLREGMELAGTVTNVTKFGAFVDIGVHQDGLVHISKLSNRFVRDPAEVVSVGDTVRVKVLSIDEKLKRISLERMDK